MDHLERAQGWQDMYSRATWYERIKMGDISQWPKLRAIALREAARHLVEHDRAANGGDTMTQVEQHWHHTARAQNIASWAWRMWIEHGYRWEYE